MKYLASFSNEIGAVFCSDDESDTILGLVLYQEKEHPTTLVRFQFATIERMVSFEIRSK